MFDVASMKEIARAYDASMTYPIPFPVFESNGEGLSCNFAILSASHLRRVS